MPILMLKNKRVSFPALAVPKAIGEGEAAYGARFIIDPNDPDVGLLDEAMAEAAVEKWREDGADVLSMLIAGKKVCFEHAPYRSTKTGKPYAGFEGKFSLGTRSAKTKPTVVNEFGKEVESKLQIEQLIYSGCYVHAKVEIWAQDNQFGRRVNAALLGVMFAGRGESFGGGSGAAEADDFADMVRKPEAEDVL